MVPMLAVVNEPPRSTVDVLSTVIKPLLVQLGAVPLGAMLRVPPLRACQVPSLVQLADLRVMVPPEASSLMV